MMYYVVLSIDLVVAQDRISPERLHLGKCRHHLSKKNPLCIARGLNFSVGFGFKNGANVKGGLS